MAARSSRSTRIEGLVIRRLGKETLVYDTRRHRAFCLGPELAAVWRASGRTTSAAEVLRRLRREGHAIDETAVDVGLARLGRARLIPRPFARRPSRSRREALRRIAALSGLSLIAIAAPTALNAATCVPLGTCITYSQSSCPGAPCCNTTLTCKRQGCGAACCCHT